MAVNSPLVIDLGSASESENNDSEPNPISDSVSNSESRTSEPPDLDSESEDPDIEDLKQNFVDWLSSIHKGGAYGIHRRETASISPGLFIDAIGEIGLPLPKRDAEKIVEACHTTNPSNGSAKTSDGSITSPGRSRVLSPDQFQLRNPAWQKYIDELVEKAADELGIYGDSLVSARLSQLQICGSEYQAPSYFGAVGKIGSLTIYLPSRHEGGGVKVSHGGEAELFSPATLSEYSQSYIARYSDVAYDVEPVTSGYQILVDYTLVQPTIEGEHESASRFLREKSELRKILSQWKETYKAAQSHKPSRLVYTLDGRYIPDRLKLSVLKGLDRVRLKYLSEVCLPEGFCLYLASLESSATGTTEYYEDYGNWDDMDDEDHELDDIEDKEFLLKYIFDLQGCEVGRDLEISETDIVQEILEDTRARGREDYHGGGSLTHHWSHTAVVVVPDENRVNFLFEVAKTTKDGVKHWLERIHEGLRKDPSNETLQHELLRLCELIAGYKSSSIHDLRSVIEFAISHRRSDLLTSVISRRKLPGSVLKRVGEAVHAVDLSGIKKGLSKSISHIDTTTEAYDALNDIVSGHGEFEQPQSDSSELAALTEWRTNELKLLIGSVRTLYKEDGRVLVDIIIELGHNVLFTRALPMVKSNMHNIPFALEFVHSLVKAHRNHKLTKSVVANVVRDIIADMICEFTLQTYKATDKRQKVDHRGLRIPFNQNRHLAQPNSGFSYEDPYLAPQSSTTIGLLGSDMVDLFGYCLDFDLTAEQKAILQKFKREANSIHPSQARAVIVPFLEQLLKVLKQHRIPHSTPRYQVYFRTLVTTYINGYVGVEPLRPPMPLPVSSCIPNCSTCVEFDRFIANNSRATADFQMKQQLREHIQRRIPASGFRTETLKGGSPLTLVVTKLQVEWKLKHAQWEDRRKKVINEINLLGFKDLLGDSYDHIVQMQDLRRNAS